MNESEERAQVRGLTVNISGNFNKLSPVRKQPTNHQRITLKQNTSKYKVEGTFCHTQNVRELRGKDRLLLEGDIEMCVSPRADCCGDLLW